MKTAICRHCKNLDRNAQCCALENGPCGPNFDYFEPRTVTPENWILMMLKKLIQRKD